MSKIKLMLTAQVVVVSVLAMTFAPGASAFTGEVRNPGSGLFTGEMRNLGSGLCMTSRGYGKGARIVQWTCNSRSPNQYWWAEGQGLGGYALFNGGSSKGGNDICLNNRGGVFYNYNPQILWPCGNVTWNERWYYSGGPYGYFKISLDKSNFYPSEYCVTSGGNKNVGSTVYEAPCSHSPNQYWSGPIVGDAGANDPSPHSL
jgi:hypothetical protein